MKSGYLAAVVGTLAGGVALGAAAGVLGVLAGGSLSKEVPEAGVFIGGYLGVIGGVWLGAAAGSWLFLRPLRDGSAGPTAARLALLLPPFLIATLVLLDNTGMPVPAGIVVVCFGAALAAVMARHWTLGTPRRRRL